MLAAKSRHPAAHSPGLNRREKPKSQARCAIRRRVARPPLEGFVGLSNADRFKAFDNNARRTHADDRPARFLEADRTPLDLRRLRRANASGAASQSAPARPARANVFEKILVLVPAIGRPKDQIPLLVLRDGKPADNPKTCLKLERFSSL